MKLGHIESTGTQLKSFYSIKEDVSDDSDIKFDRGGDGTGMSSDRSAKADISLDLDNVIQTEYGDLHEVLNNRVYPHKLYLREPAADSQRIKITGVGNLIGKHWASDISAPSLSNFACDATLFSSGDYTAIQDFTNLVSYSSSCTEFIHLFLQFDLSTWIAAYGLDYLTRLTLFMQDPLVERQVLTEVDNYGYAVSVYNNASDSWTEVKRQSITVDASNQQYAALRPIDGFTRWADYLSSNLLLMRISNLQPRNSSGTLTLSLNYAELFINGYGVIQVNPFNINWREPYTGAGYTGSLRFKEI